MWINDGNPLVAEEYSKVSKENLKSFFTYRGMELVSGGLLFVMMMSRKDPDRKEIQFGQPLGTSSPISGMFELAWNDLVAEVCETCIYGTLLDQYLQYFGFHHISLMVQARG